jgi:hypothetical protein
MTTMIESTNPDHHINENIDEIQNASLILRLYGSLKSNSRFQSGIQQLERFSAPIIEKYHLYVDDNIDKVKTRIVNWVASENVYNHLASLFLYQNMPFTGSVTSFDEFTRSFESLKIQNKEKEIMKTFYDIVKSLWTALNNPSNEDIRNALLDTVAKTISKVNNFENDSFATGLYSMFKTLIEKSKEFVTEESFVSYTKLYLGEANWKKAEHGHAVATREFYTFAKRFVLLDAPTCLRQSMNNWIVSNIKDKSIGYVDCSFNLVEGRINKIIEHFGIKHEAFPEALSVIQRPKIIALKAFFIVNYFYAVGLDKIKGSNLYITANKKFDLENRFNSLVVLGTNYYTQTRVKVVDPAIEFVKINHRNVKEKVEVIFDGLNVEAVKTNYSILREKFTFLKNCTAIIKDDVLKLVFDRKALLQLGEDAKSELLHVYSELKTLEKKKVENVGVELYKKALAKLNSVRARAGEVKAIENH